MFSLIDLVFLSFVFSMLVGGFFINNLESVLPTIFVQLFRYGEFSYKGVKNDLLTTFEIPKSYFKHFYVFSSAYSIGALIILLRIYSVSDDALNRVFILDVLCGTTRKPVCGVAALTALSLLTLQCLRRFYETHYIQVFAQKSKINLSHYFVGYFHYFGIITVILAYSPKLTGTLNKFIWLDTYTSFIYVPALLLFSIAWLKQYESNLILANLRKDPSSGNVVTEKFDAPYGGCFRYVSSPHRLTEIMMYFSVWLLVPKMSCLFVLLWVLVNQVETALLAHWWYKDSFKDYPRERRAIFPFVL